MPPRSLTALVDHQIKRWEIEQRASVPDRGAPCIALSRQPGSGAREIGRQAAEWLDYGFFDIEIVDQIARQQQVRRELVAGLDEHLRSVIDRTVIDWFQSRSFTESDYARELVHTLSTLGQRGMAVILGRGAPFVLSTNQALRVLIVAPRAKRVERLAAELGVATAEANGRLEKADAERHAFLRHYFDVDPDDPMRYDLVLNTGHLSLESAASIIVDTLRRRFPSQAAPASPAAEPAEA